MTHVYRPEIDGLRTVAVVPVVLFHAGATWIPGGFVGVDVFFVISGYLITRILLQDIDQDRFSLLTFYARRIRRIFPALFVVLAVSTVLASQLLLWDEFNEYARSMVFSTLFLANHHFMGDVGYFANTAETKPLLHMWSLAVEEQFYIVFPLFLYWVYRKGQAALISLTLTLLIASLLLCLWLTSYSPDTAFYIAPARAWELLIGAVLAMAPARFFPKGAAVCNAIGLAGLVAIMWAMLSINKATPFPGAAAMLPAFGTAAIIYSSTYHRGWVGELLATAPMRGVGLISYSLYLWHWPLIVFYRFWRIEHPAPWEMAIVVAVSVLMATLSWRFVERPFRVKALLPSRRSTLTAGVATLMVFTVIGGVIDLKDGFRTAYPAPVNAALQAAHRSWARPNCETHQGLSAPKETTVCPLGEGAIDTATFAVWGDSHGAMLLPAFDEAVSQTGRDGIFVGHTGCTPLLGVTRRLQDYALCGDVQADILAYLEHRTDISDIFLISRWSRYALGTTYGTRLPNPIYIADTESPDFSLEENQAAFARGLARTLTALTAMGKRVHILGPVPEADFNIPREVARTRWYARDVELRPSLTDYRQRNAYVQGLFEEAHSQGLISTLMTVEPLLCAQSHCRIMHEGKPGYQDDNHLNPEMARALTPLLTGIIGSHP